MWRGIGEVMPKPRMISMMRSRPTWTASSTPLASEVAFPAITASTTRARVSVSTVAPTAIATDGFAPKPIRLICG